MSIRNVFPTVRPSLNLNFARSKTLDPRITFSRTSVGTYLDSDGLIKTAAADTPRFDHKYENGNIVSLGLLIEAGETNSVRNSEDLTAATWNDSVGDGVTVTTNQAVAPDGNTTADKVAIKTSGSGSKAIQSSILTGTSSGTVITSSIFCKAVEHSYVRVQMEGGGNSGGIVVDLSDGSLITEFSSPDSYKIEPYPNDWYRISATSTTANSTNATALRVHLTDSSGNSTWTGTIGNGVYMWGGQHEIASRASSYIPTDDTAAGITRTKEVCYIDGTNFTEFYNPVESTIYVRFDMGGIFSTGGYNRIYEIWESANTVRYSLLRGGADDTTYDSFSFGSGSDRQQLNYNTVSIEPDTLFKSISAFKNDDYQRYAIDVNGVLDSNTDTSVGVGTFSPIQFMLGSEASSEARQLNGHISELRYYPKRLSNDQLQNLTK